MNRRQKIIVSVTGIFLVLLLLVGLTYAYFLTQVTGNTNTKSISVSTANLALVYGDGNGTITATNIQPGKTLDEKSFTVTNQGNATTDYVVVIDNVNVVYAETRTINGVTQTKGATTEFESNDFVYTLTCTNKDGSDCINQIKSEQEFPIKGGVVVSNSIEVEGVQSYTLTVTYRETGVDQSNDMNKELNAIVNIKDISVDNPYKSDTTLLAYNILNNAMSVTEAQKNKGYAELVSTPPTVVTKEISEENESVMAATADEYGTSYYYRGAVKNNYLEFNGMCWRIVRIEGDGSIKITLAAQKACSQITAEDTGSAFIGTGDYGYDENDNVDYENSINRTNSMKYKFNIFLMGGSFDYNYLIDDEEAYTTVTYNAWSQTNLDKLKSEEVCIGDTDSAYTSAGELMTETEKQEAISNYENYYYKNYIRLYTDQIATLMCDTSGNKTTSAKIYPLTVDEVVFAGGKAGTANYSYYLRENAIANSWLTISIFNFNGRNQNDTVFHVYSNGRFGWTNAGWGHDLVSLRPSVSLASGAKIASGDGSISNPYTIQ